MQGDVLHLIRMVGTDTLWCKGRRPIDYWSTEDAQAAIDRLVSAGVLQEGEAEVFVMRTPY
jgi:hypothetical protein